MISIEKIRVGEGLDTDSFVVIFQLKPINIVLIEDTEKTMAGVRWQAHGKLRLQTWRINITNNNLESGIEVQGLFHVVLI